MREKLGIKQKISVSDLENLKTFDPKAPEYIEVALTPNENLLLNRLRQLRVWVSLGLVTSILYNFIEDDEL